MMLKVANRSETVGSDAPALVVDVPPPDVTVVSDVSVVPDVTVVPDVSVVPEISVQDRPLGPPVTRAVLPALALGSGLLPATKVLPQEMLPVVDAPAVQYVVEEAAAAGITDLLCVIDSNATPLEDHFDEAPELEAALALAGDTAALAQVRRPMALARLHYLRRREPGGAGQAVLRARTHVEENPFAVLLADELIDDHGWLLGRMTDLQRRTQGCVLALAPASGPASGPGMWAAVAPTAEADVVRVTRVGGSAPPAGAMAVVGRFVLHPRVFEALRAAAPGSAPEALLADALDVLARTPAPAAGGAAEAGGVHGVIVRGPRHCLTDPLGYVQAVISYAVKRPDVGPALRAWLRDLVAADD